MAIGVEGRRKRVSRWVFRVRSLSRWMTRRYWVRLKALSFVRDWSHFEVEGSVYGAGLKAVAAEDKMLA